MKASVIYTQTLRELRYGTRRIIHQGGQWSGKTVNILGALATCAAEESGNDAGITTITSMSFPHLKGGALRDFEMYVYPSFQSVISKYHKTDHLFTFKSGSMLEFKVYENEMSARGSKRKRLFINEANKFEYMTFFQLDSRSEQSILDYNPSLRFFAHEKLIGFPGNKLFISDHRHNPFIPKSKHDEIEAYYDVRKPEGGELFKVYSRGLTGNIQGIIFPQWEMIDDADFPKDHEAEFIFSIDFGYTNDPTVIIKQCVVGNTLFVKELSYNTGLSPLAIQQILFANGYAKDEVLYCDHDPDMIRELRNVGLRYAMPARKGQGSINAGIEMLNRFDVKYTNSSTNLHRDRSKYIWEEDKLNPGKFTNIPVDSFNHCFDAIRYGVYSKFLKLRAA